MQQVAAQKIDIAALPVSDSKSGDADEIVLKGHDVLADSEQFRTFYGDAKREAVLDKTTSNKYFNKKTIEGNSAKGREGENETSLDKLVNPHKENLKAAKDGLLEDDSINTLTQESEGLTTDQLMLEEANAFTLADITRYRGDPSNGNNEVDPEAGSIALPSPRIDEAKYSTTDWIDYVETVLGNKAVQGEQNESSVSGNNDLDEGIELTSPNMNAKSSTMLPDDVDESSISSISAYLITQLDGQTEPPFANEVIIAVKELSSLLSNTTPIQSEVEGIEGDMTLSSDSLLASMVHFFEKSGNEHDENQLEAVINTSGKDGFSLSSESDSEDTLLDLSADEQLVLSLLTDAVASSKVSNGKVYVDNSGQKVSFSKESTEFSDDINQVASPAHLASSLASKNNSEESVPAVEIQSENDEVALSLGSELGESVSNETAAIEVIPVDSVEATSTLAKDGDIPPSLTHDDVQPNNTLSQTQEIDKEPLIVNPLEIEGAEVDTSELEAEQAGELGDIAQGEILNQGETVDVLTGHVNNQANENTANSNLPGPQTSTDNNIGDEFDNQSETLLTSLSLMSPESAQKATEAFAERVVASLPAGTTQAQQQAAKANIIASINEFQQQLTQGHEPGIDLSAMVSDAISEAGLLQSQAQAVARTTDTLAGQFMQLVNSAQHSAQDALQNDFTRVDTQVAENNQIRVESSKTQLQIDGGERGVNILKPEGQQQLHEKIRWMVNARNTMAEIRLDPPELGSMQVRVNMSGDAASVSFVVQSQHAKDALADAMPKLKEMLAEQGIALGDAEVRKDNSSQSGEENGQQLAGQGNGSSRRENDGELDESTRVIEQRVTHQAKGGIDYYA